MLVLSRRVGESVCVGPGVTIRVIETKGNRVRLAIDAPADVRITRGELSASLERPKTFQFKPAGPWCLVATP